MTAQPPLLALAAGRRVRPRKAPLIRPKELDLHMAVADLLRRFCRPEWRWSHMPSGELRDPRTAAKLKAMGTMPGWPDLILLSPNGVLHGLELKRVGENLSEAQQAFQMWAVARGVPYSVARSIDEVVTILGAWRCLRVDLRSGGAA